MAETRRVSTSVGPVEVVRVPGERPPVLFFPGGHCSAMCDCGWDLYSALGHGVVSFSRPGSGGTRVGALSPAEFAPLVREVCEQLDNSVVAAAVGVSFGGMQAVHVSGDRELGVAAALAPYLCAVWPVLSRQSRGGDWRPGRVLSAPAGALVTGSRHDRGVSFAHAQDFVDTIPAATPIELDSPSHIFWIGPGRARLTSIIRSFIDEDA